MTRINTAMTSNVFTEWVQRNQEQIKTHPAWHNDISENTSEKLLEDQIPFTYLLRSGGKEHAYLISFMKEDRAIKHQAFVLELDRRGWYYRNGSGTCCPTEIVSKDLHELIPLMMHCDSTACNPLTKMNAILR